jgi:cytochrome bd ubiquinol oxidase subunit II
MDLPLLSALFAAFALSLYVMLDGFDLGVGVLLLAQSDEQLRDRMVDSITPTWDGNETWLIMTGVALLAAFPIAYGILLPAFYLPLIAMLLALGLRGVSFEFRYQVERGRWAWDVAFGLGSIIAALMQGFIVGGLIQGVAVDGERFSGSVFDVFQPFSLLVAVSVLAGYMVLGGGWLHLKATRNLHGFAERGHPSSSPWRSRPAPRRPSFSPAFRKRGHRIRWC